MQSNAKRIRQMWIEWFGTFKRYDQCVIISISSGFTFRFIVNSKYNFICTCFAFAHVVDFSFTFTFTYNDITHLYFTPFNSPRAILAVSKLYVSWSLINAAAAPFKSSSDGNFITFRCIVTFSKNSKTTHHINQIELNFNEKHFIANKAV